MVHTWAQTRCYCGSGRCIYQTWLLQQPIVRSICNQHWQNAEGSKISLHRSLLDLCVGLISPLSWPPSSPYMGYWSGSESFIKLHQLPVKLVYQNHHHICRAYYWTILLTELFVLLPTTLSVNAAQKLPQVREILVWLVQNSETIYLTLYDDSYLTLTLPH